VTRGGDNDWSVDSVRVHARLVIVVHGDESPVGDNTGDAEGAICVGTGDEVFDRRGVEEFDVREGENFGKQGGGEECLFEELG
jgi:hypothetical protein